MSRQLASQVWISPPKYWEATAHLSPRQSEEFAEMIEACAAAGDIDFLKKFPFISFTDPIQEWRNARKTEKERA